MSLAQPESLRGVRALLAVGVLLAAAAVSTAAPAAASALRVYTAVHTTGRLPESP